MNPRERVASITERVIKLNEDSGLKISSGAWGLDVGQGLGRTSINQFAHSLLLSITFPAYMFECAYIFDQLIIAL